jgi:hypothetical protein
MYAYYGAVFQRNKNPNSDLEKIISKINETAEEMSDEDMLAVLKKYVAGS